MRPPSRTACSGPGTAATRARRGARSLSSWPTRSPPRSGATTRSGAWMRPSSTTEETGAADRASAGRGSRLLTDWILETLKVYGSNVEPLEGGGWDVRVGAPLVPVLGRRSFELVPAREAEGASAEGEK